MKDRSVRKDLPLAIVVGACGGMGLAAARRMGQLHQVLLLDIDAAALDRFAAQLRDEGVSAEAAYCDVTDDASVAEVFLAHTRPLRAVVHVVALSPVSGDWRRIIDVNLCGAARIMRAAMPALQRGVGIFVSSVAAYRGGDLQFLEPLLDDPLQADFIDKLERAVRGEIDPTRAYRISKYGLNRLCRIAAAEWGARGNRIVTLSPGLIATPMGDREFQARSSKWELLQRVPLGRQGGLTEVVDAMEFLCSERASYITGSDLLVDGGLVGASTPRPRDHRQQS
jgi:NAD(P)-dependent dehydrogenase (short-subunit alcohol dehydrogenase family)